MDKSVIKKFISKVIILATPILIVVGLYLIFDPFKVLHNYKSYYESGKPNYVILNRDFVCVETLKDYYSVYKYDSYIFGNSRSLFYEVRNWQKYIHSDGCFHFDASEESIFGINRKIQYLHKKGIIIKNALIVLDHGILEKTSDSKGILFMKHPALSGSNFLDFQMEYFKGYFDYKFLVPYFDLKFSKKYKPYMSDVLHSDSSEYELKYNEIRNPALESKINKNPDDYYLKNKSVFYLRDTIQKIGQVVIKKEQQKLLTEIIKIFKQNNTDYKIVISPLYDQIKLNPEDLKYLCNVFGKENVFDFSGRNQITNNIYNYYEYSHYRPLVASFIMSEIYETHQSLCNP